MNEPEYKAFWNKSALAFPRIAEFFAVADFKSNRPLQDDEWNERHFLWKETFYPLDSEDCNRSLSDMVAGKIPGPCFDCSDFPAKIRAQASEYRSKRAHAIANAKQHEYLRGGSVAAGERVKVEMGAATRAVQILAQELFAQRMPEEKFPWNYLGVSKEHRCERYFVWRECTQQALAEVWPEGDNHPTLPEGARVQMQPLLKRVESVNQEWNPYQ